MAWSPDPTEEELARLEALQPGARLDEEEAWAISRLVEEVRRHRVPAYMGKRLPDWICQHGVRTRVCGWCNPPF